MSLTMQDRKYFELRDIITEHESVAVHSAFHAVVDALRIHGLRPAMDDRAAALEGAIVRYVIDSRHSQDYQ